MAASKELLNPYIEVDMYCDWDTSVGMSAPLAIPENTRVTLNMDGYKIDRELTVSILHDRWKRPHIIDHETGIRRPGDLRRP